MSSVTMKIALLPVQERDPVMVSTAPCTNASAFRLSAASFGSSLVEPNGQGVSGCPGTATFTPPCMSLHWFGVIQTKSGACGEFRSAASAE